MKHAEYTQLAERSLSSFFYAEDMTTQHLLHGSIGIVTELPELAEALENNDIVNIGEELADILWYVSIFDRHYKTVREEIGRPSAISGELIFKSSGELLDIFKKKLFYNRAIDDEKVIALVDIVHGEVEKICVAYEINIDEIRAKNIEKLKARFPEKFTVEAANNRNLDQERAILES